MPEATDGRSAEVATNGRTQREARRYSDFRTALQAARGRARKGDRSSGGEHGMDSIGLPVTLVTAGGAAIINFWLAMRVGAARRATGVSIGDGGDLRLIARMRAQANFVEYAPFILILIGLIEFTEGPIDLALAGKRAVPHRPRRAWLRDGRRSLWPDVRHAGDDAACCWGWRFMRSSCRSAQTHDTPQMRYDRDGPAARMISRRALSR